MIELIIVWRLAVHIGRLANRKGLKKLRYQVMLVLLWLCGELLGAIGARTILELRATEPFCLTYLVALLGAAVGGATAFLVVHLLPAAPLPTTDECSPGPEVPATKNFARSGWVPAIVILLAFSCVLCGGLAGFTLVSTRSAIQQIHASIPIVGSQLTSTGEIPHPTSRIESKAKVIYLSFYCDIPEGRELPATVDWVVDGQLAYTTSQVLTRGPVIVALDRIEMGVSEFPKGEYVAAVHSGHMPLTSVSFRIE